MKNKSEIINPQQTQLSYLNREVKPELSSPQDIPIPPYRTTAVYQALVRSPVVRDYQKAFQQATGLLVTLTPVGEAIRLLSFQRSPNPFCRLMAQFPGSCKACEQVHQDLEQQIADSLAPQIIRCFAGLAEFAVPILADRQHIATLVGGQVFLRPPTQALFARMTRRLRTWGFLNEFDRVETEFFQTQVITRKQLQAGVRLLLLFTKLLADDVNRNLLAAQAHEGPCITSARDFILAHASEPLRLRDVAEHIHISTGYFCKFFKKATGIKFSEFLARVRVQNAKNLLADPDLAINEVSHEAGFGSLSQFNRTFRHYVGCSPKAYRASLP